MKLQGDQLLGAGAALGGGRQRGLPAPAPASRLDVAQSLAERLPTLGQAAVDLPQCPALTPAAASPSRRWLWRSPFRAGKHRSARDTGRAMSRENVELVRR